MRLVLGSLILPQVNVETQESRFYRLKAVYVLTSWQRLSHVLAWIKEPKAFSLLFDQFNETNLVMIARLRLDVAAGRAQVHAFNLKRTVDGWKRSDQA